MSSDEASYLEPAALESAASSYGWGDRLALRAIERTLPFLQVLNEPAGVLQFQDNELSVQVQLRRPGTLRRVLTGGSLAAAESFIRGEWECTNLTQLIQIFIRNHLTADQLDGRLAWIMNWGNRLLHGWRRNTLDNSRSNIAAHYDLGEAFFRLWLDPTLSYSSAIFLDPSATLEHASRHKIDLVCQKLELTAADQVLEIGCGWGAFAVRAAEHYGCRVTATTISADQHRVAQERFQASPAASRLKLLQTDYRELQGSYDKLVSIEMIEAVGREYYATFFEKCDELLNTRGRFLMQAIIIPENRAAAYWKSVDFIQRYIFPGGCLPSLSALLAAAAENSDLQLRYVEDYTPDYARTVRHWKEAFVARLPEVREQGYSEEFIRMWLYYLCYCEALFAERYVSLLQIEWAKPGALPRESDR